ncbi:MAG TPA: ParB/RepB/Spo0J family partition protein [Sedimentisphaerales bacterium]|nr:ParB/RepB/Spo0J family partition protein [Sedimentisphaerales bacterium]
MKRTTIEHIPLDRLVPHPDSPNRMSRANADKLLRNIARTGRYEPLVVRPCPGRDGFYQILNGRHRCEAIRKLGLPAAEAVVWDVDDEQADILLGTLNRLGGRDCLGKKLTLLRRLTRRIPIRKLARLLPQTLGQIERLTSSQPLGRATAQKASAFAKAMVFFVDEGQQQRVEEALLTANPSGQGRGRAAARAAALDQIAGQFLARTGDQATARGS